MFFDIEVTVTSGALPDDFSGLNSIGLSVSVVFVGVVFLLCIIVAAVLLAMLVVRRIKGNVRTFQLERLTRLVTCLKGKLILPSNIFSNDALM